MKISIQFKLSLQAIIALISLVLIAIYPIILAALYSPKFLVNNIHTLVASALVIILFLFVRVFEINCFVYGGCVWHSWVMVGVSLLVTVLYCIYLTRFANSIKWNTEHTEAELKKGVQNSMDAVNKFKNLVG